MPDAESASAQVVPELTFDSDDFAPGEALALWAASVPYDAMLPEGVRPEMFRTRMRAWRVDSLLLTDAFMTAMRFVRSPARIRSDGGDSISLIVAVDGSWRGDFDGSEVEVPRGRVCLLDFARPFELECPESRFILAYMPRATLELAEGGAADRHGGVLDGLPGRLLTDHFIALAHRLPGTAAADLPTVAAVTLAMIRTCLARLPRRDRSPAALSLRQRVRAYVDAHLTDPDLTPEVVMRALSTTRATLYRAFPMGGVVGYIQGRRLEAIHALLDRRGEMRTLQDLALSFGFSSQAHFSTAFRRQFGYSPSRARDAHVGARDERARSVDIFQDWMSALTAASRVNRRT